MGALDKLAKPAETRGSDIFDIDALPEDNRVAFNLLFFNLKNGWATPFGLMLLMSAGIATLGLSEDSAATVIGAMIVAPLGQPILALGASVAIGWPQQMMKMLAVVALGAAAVVATGFLLNMLLPPATGSSQVLTRTAPDLRDLGIAVFAAVAGAYGYYRSEFSSVLAGVAIAVALVPPLCVAGMMLEEDKLILAYGAFLLFLTNFAGITLASLLVFFLTGSVAAPERRCWFIGGAIATLVFAAILLGPLAANFDRVAGPANDRASLYRSVSTVLDRYPGEGNIVSLSLVGSDLRITVDHLSGDPARIATLTSEIERSTQFQVEIVAQ